MSDEMFVQTSHEDEERKGTNQIGHAILLIFTIGLLIMTSFRTWDFIAQSMPKSWGAMGMIIAAFGLLAIDVGTIIWLYLWIKVSASPLQDMLEMGMFIADALAVLVANVLDSAMYDKMIQVPLDFEQIGRWGIPIIIVVNALAGLIWYMLDQTTGVDRALRRKAALVSKKQLELKLNDQILAQRGRQVAQMTRQAAEDARLSAMERGVALAREDDSAARTVAERTAGRIKSKVIEDLQSIPNNGHEPLPNASTPRQPA